MPSFDKKFNHQFLIGSEKTRLRKFDPKSFFISILHLVQGKNNEGYFHALAWTWDILSDLTQAPVKSAFAKVRKRVSFNFFKTLFDELIDSHQSSPLTWRGLRVYAIDGDMYELPRTLDVLANGYEGRACKYGMETHYPFLYVNHCYDVLSGITKAFDYNHKHEEFHSAQRIARKLERESVTLYDRYFFCKNLVRAHRESQSYFVARIKKGGAGTLLAMREFGRGKERARTFDFEGVRVRLLRIKNPRTGSELLLATNLPWDQFAASELADLYALRWDVETAHRDLSHTMKMGQWHSKHLNGILQELYASLWLMNQSRIQMLPEHERNLKLLDMFCYAKANFKLVSDYLVRHIGMLVDGAEKRFFDGLSHLLKIATERRRRRSRSYPRQVRGSRKIYPSASLRPRAK